MVMSMVVYLSELNSRKRLSTLHSSVFGEECEMKAGRRSCRSGKVVKFPKLQTTAKKCQRLMTIKNIPLWFRW